MRVKLGENYFTIPKEDILDPNVPFWVRLIPGLDASPGEMILQIDAEKIATEIPKYTVFDGRYKENIILLLQVLNEKDLKQNHDPNFYSDLWYSKGWYGDGKRIIEQDEATGFYKVYSKAGYPVFWVTLKVYPDSEKPLPANLSDFFVANCLGSTVPSPLTATGKSIDCHAKAFYENIMISFSVSVANLTLLEEIKAFLVNSLVSWKEERAGIE